MLDLHIKGGCMSDTVNPWQSPAAAVKAEENAPQGVLTAAMIRFLKEASPWLRFIGILGYIGVGFCIVAGVIMAIALMISGAGQSAFAGFAGFASTFMGLIYIVAGVMAFFPARFTHRFGVKIRHYLLNGAEKDLEEAFKNNRSLWKFAGIVMIVYLALVPVGIIVAVVVAVSSSLL
jgi:magnesium-transporting ATPase (P-type)